MASFPHAGAEKMQRSTPAGEREGGPPVAGGVPMAKAVFGDQSEGTSAQRPALDADHHAVFVYHSGDDETVMSDAAGGK